MIGNICSGMDIKNNEVCIKLSNVNLINLSVIESPIEESKLLLALQSNGGHPNILYHNYSFIDNEGIHVSIFELWPTGKLYLISRFINVYLILLFYMIRYVYTYGT